LTYTATWIQDEYTVVYDPGDHGTWTTTSETYAGLVYGNPMPAFSGNLATDHTIGWSFVAWTPSVPATVPDASTSTVTTLTYTATWIQDEYTVVFDPGDHGTWTDSSETYTGLVYGNTIPAFGNNSASTTADDHDAGWTFNGWSPSVPATVPDASTGAVTFLTYIAQWVQTEYTVAYNLGAVEATMPSSTLITVTWFDSNLIPAIDPIRPGYTFDGWKLVHNGNSTPNYLAGITNGKIIDNSDTFGDLAFNDAVIGIMFAAQWTANTYTITYITNGGNNLTPPDKTVTFDSPYGALPIPTRTGYTFDGWYLASDLSGTAITNTTVVKTADNHNLYAGWQPINYLVTFDANTTATGIGGMPSVNPASVVFEQPYGTLPVLTRSGYTFNGWFTASSDGTQVLATTTVTNDFDHTLYAHWTVNPQYTVTYNGNGNTSGSAPVDNSAYAAGGTAIILGQGTLQKDGYTFLGWHTDPNAIASVYSPGYAHLMSSSITLYAVWQESGKYTVTVNGSYAATTGAGSYGQGANVTINAGTRDGYTFSGWTVTVGGVTLASSSSATTTFTMPANDVTVTANWTQAPAPTTYTVTYNGNGNSGGSVPVDSASPYTAGSTVTVIGNTGNLVKTGYTFLGWADADDYVTRIALGSLVGRTAQYVAGSTFTINSNTTLYAVWQAETETTYTVTYNGNGNSGGSVPVDSASPYTAGSTVTVIGNTGNLVKIGYTFLGWSTNQSATTAQYTAGSTFIINSNTTLYAVWQAETETTYRVTYVGGGDTRGVAPIDPNSYLAGDTATVLGAGNLVRSNYAFLGWSTSANATTVEYNAGDSITVNGNITLYAVWETGGNGTPWALLNLILAITGALVAIGAVVYAFVRKNKNTKMLWLIVSIALGIASLIVFFLTEKTGNPVVFVNWWTIANAVILILGVTSILFAFKHGEGNR
ncbi:MAG: InlB B-repeat-containing protein, partial [Dehalococcoidia bacterium]|nr:InlB B-repeat-containing protein [Dehalococcoidia bacterium]